MPRTQVPTVPGVNNEPVTPSEEERTELEVLEAVNEGDQILRINGQIPGASLVIKIRANENSVVEEFGPFPASIEKEVALKHPLLAGSIVTVTQSHDGISCESDAVIVQPRPAAFAAESTIKNAPVMIAPLYHGGHAVQVSNLYPGALVNVFSNGMPIGIGWAGLEGSLNMRVGPLLIEGAQITANQIVGGVESGLSEPVTVQRLNSLPAPRIMGPVAQGDTYVRLSNVTPGSHLVLYMGLSIVGEMDATETVVRFPTFSPAFFLVLPPRVVATLGDLTAETTFDGPLLKPPSDLGPIVTLVAEKFLDFGNFMVPATSDGDIFESPIEGQLYYRIDVDEDGAPIEAIRRPLVILAHGWWPDHIVPSYLGYDYLARHLVRWGMVVFSIDLTRVNDFTWRPKVQQYARAEIILHAIDELLNDPTVSQLIDHNYIGLVGHSLGGEAVAVTQYVNQTQGRGYQIKGVASIAPTHFRPEVVVRDTKYMQIFGSKDELTSSMTGTDEEAEWSGFRTYDRAWRPKTHFWIYGLLHEPFNKLWGQEYGFPPNEPLAQNHQLVAKCLVNAFLQDALFDKHEYAKYMEGTVLPQSLDHLEIYTQHSNHDGRTVVDNFGDVDGQAQHPAQSLEKTTNTQNLPVSADGLGLNLWADIDHTTLTNSPHNTKGVRLSWINPGTVYVSNIPSLQIGLDQVFSLRVGQFYPDDALNPAGAPLDLFVALSDGSNEATVRLGSVAQLPYPSPPAYKVLCPMRTVRLPVDAFKAANPNLNLANIQNVKLKLIGRETGHILADDFEFSLE